MWRFTISLALAAVSALVAPASYAPMAQRRAPTAGQMAMEQRQEGMRADPARVAPRPLA